MMTAPVDNPWYALAADDGRYLGMAWQSNSSGGLVRPRLELVPPEGSRNETVSTWPAGEYLDAAIRRARQVLGVDLRPVRVRVVRPEKDPDHPRARREPVLVFEGVRPPGPGRGPRME